MAGTKQKWINAIIVLSILVIISGVFVMFVTYGADLASPDATITYTRNNLEWSLALDDNGSAVLDIFGEPEDGEELPIIHPYSKGKYYVRISNQIHGAVGYCVYLYSESAADIPLSFEVTRRRDMTDLEDVPSDLAGKNVLDKVCGSVRGMGMETLEIDWFWDSQSDSADTSLGNAASLGELEYKINMLIVIEDNNTYHSDHAGGKARLLHRAYVNGYPDGTFLPDGNTKRSEAAAIFARILANYREDSLKSTRTGFSDVKKEAWYAKYTCFLEDKSIINGYPDGTFLPEQSITRAEFVAMSIRFFEQANGRIRSEDTSFSDLDESHWCYELMGKAVALGYITGYPDGSVRPDAKITRAEVVTVVNRMLCRYADKAFIDDYKNELIRFTDLESGDSHWAYYDICEASNTHHLQKREENEYWVVCEVHD